MLVLEPQSIKSTERAKQLLIPPVYSLRGIRAYDELQIVVTEVGQVKQTVTTLTVMCQSAPLEPANNNGVGLML